MIALDYPQTGNARAMCAASGGVLCGVTKLLNL